MRRRMVIVLVRRTLGRCAAVVALVTGAFAATALASQAAAPAWDVSGSWTSAYLGSLQLAQSASGSLSGTFQMKAGCSASYAVTGTIDGSSVKLNLTLPGGQDVMPCAGTQGLSGSVGSGGTTLSLALSNNFMTSPATDFTGKAKSATAQATTTTAKTTTTTKATTTTAASAGTTFDKSYAVSVKCTSRTQLCADAFSATVPDPKGKLAVQFTTSKGHCADVRFIFSVDGGTPQSSGFIGAGKSTPEFVFPAGPGQHHVQVRAESRPGGCNTIGYLLRWAGTLSVRSTGSTAASAGTTFGKSFPVFVKCTSKTQLCADAFSATVPDPKGKLAVRFTTSSAHCADVRFIFSVDGGTPQTSAFIGRAKSTPEFAFAAGPGQHHVQVRAESRPGGCNTIGYLVSWNGTLSVRSTG